MSGWGKYVAVIVAGAAVAAVGLWITRPGPLAVHGGARVVLQAAPTDPSQWPSERMARIEMMQRVQRTMMGRLKAAGLLSEPTVVILGDDKIVVEAPGVRNARSFARTLLDEGTLEFYYLRNVQNANNPLGKWRIEPADDQQKSYVFTGSKGETIDSNKNPKEVLSLVVGAPKESPVLTGRDLLPTAKADMGQNGGAVIKIEFNSDGTAIFRDFTRSHVSDYLAVFFDGRLLTAPTINEPIPGGQAEISGFRSLDEARATAEYLNSGALPVPLKVVSAETVQPRRAR